MKRQRGFSIVMAIFVLVVLGLLGGYMVRLSGVQFGTSVYALQGARAYQAARAGIEWAIARINNGGGCTEISAQTALSFPGITGFTVKLSCTRLAYFEADKNLSFYRIKALGQYGDYSGNDYVAREIEVKLIK
jgi:MSHA biogenesis protein MshP